VTPASGTAITDVSAPHVHQGLVNGVAYHYVVTAVRDGIESPPSPAASATPFAPADTTAPTFSGLTSATALGATQVQLSWAPATDDQTPQSGMVYDVYQGTSSALDFSATSQTTAAGATSLTVTGLAAGTTYYFAVRARDAAGNLDDNTVTRAATTHEQSAWPAEWAAHEEEVLTLVNQRRALGATCGDTIYPPAAPLSMQPALREAARLHSQDMATQDYFSHTSLDGRSPWTRCADAGYPCSGENIAAGHATPAHVVAGWTASPGHCANMMKSTFTLIGVGYAYDGTSTYRHYWTQNFGR